MGSYGFVGIVVHLAWKALSQILGGSPEVLSQINYKELDSSNLLVLD